MVITSSVRPNIPSNGDVSLTALQGPGHYEELDLDFIDWRRDDQGRVCFHCHDAASNPVTVRIRESLIEEVMFPGSNLHRSIRPPDWR